MNMSLGKLFQESETEKFLPLERIDVAQIRQLQIDDLDVQSLRSPAVETLEREKEFVCTKRMECYEGNRDLHFCLNVFKQVLYVLGVKHVRSSAYHPESQGALKHYYQTLKTMFSKYSLERAKCWD